MTRHVGDRLFRYLPPITHSRPAPTLTQVRRGAEEHTRKVGEESGRYTSRMRWLREHAVLAVAVLGTAALVALAVLAMTGSVLSRVHEIEGQRGGTLTVVSLEGSPDLDPARINDVYGTMIARAVDRTPYTFRPDRSGPQPDLAEGTPEISDDSRQVRVTIRSGVHFSPPVNREVTSRDVAYGIARGFLPGVDSPAAQLYFADVKGVAAVAAGRRILPSGLRTPDDHTLEISLRGPTGRLVADALTLPLAAPVPPEYARRFDRLPHSNYGRHQVFTGPYRIAAGRAGSLPASASRRITLERNPAWDSGEDFRPAFLHRIVLEQDSPGAGTLARRVLGGRAAVNGNAPAGADLLRALRARRAQVALPPAGEVTFIALNTRRAPFDDPEVRRAVSAALDRDALRDALGGVAVGEVATHWIPPGVPGFEEAGGPTGPGVDFLASPRGNLPLARRYLRRAGYARGRITGLPVLELVARRDASGAAFAAATRKALAALGLRSRVRFLSFRPFIRACTRAPRVAACLGYRWQRDIDDAASVLPPLFGRSGLRAGTNASRLSNSSLERLMDEAAATTGEADRAERWADVDRRVTELAPGVPIVWNREPNLRSADVKGVLDRDLAAWDLSFTSLRTP
jgi:peptide/nickel transport system substrate-binding protein